MHISLDNLQSSIKRKHVFKYKPEFSESFKTEINDGQIIPLTIEVFKKLEWPIVYTSKNSVEAKRKGDFNKLTEKITITKHNSGSIEVHSKSIESNFWDVGRNSKRTGLFIALFQKLALEYKENEKLTELEAEFEKQNSWADYEIPTTLPQPKTDKQHNLLTILTGGLSAAILVGVLVGFLSQKFIYIIFLFELGTGFLFGYLFNKIIKIANFKDFSKIRLMIGLFVFIIFITNQYFQFHLMITENNIPDLDFIEFQKYRLKLGFVIDKLNTGWIGQVAIWILQLVLPFLFAQIKIIRGMMNQAIEKIPEKVLEYAIYLLEMGKPESEIRAELASKGWSKKNNQDDVFDAIHAIIGFQQNDRE
ncbi:hypothetical protein [uncultured Aquimarina sp.]|uniref:hypothetical protein n=1 Tax=uncultured Aquimarina sp. TaxID=575652 RepID=UPI00261E7806|nr:hypothetical protein [uncultured Aquimarina sp.]